MKDLDETARERSHRVREGWAADSIAYLRKLLPHGAQVATMVCSRRRDGGRMLSDVLVLVTFHGSAAPMNLAWDVSRALRASWVRDADHSTILVRGAFGEEKSGEVLVTRLAVALFDDPAGLTARTL